MHCDFHIPVLRLHALHRVQNSDLVSAFTADTVNVVLKNLADDDALVRTGPQLMFTESALLIPDADGTNAEPEIIKLFWAKVSCKVDWKAAWLALVVTVMDDFELRQERQSKSLRERHKTHRAAACLICGNFACSDKESMCVRCCSGATPRSWIVILDTPTRATLRATLLAFGAAGAILTDVLAHYILDETPLGEGANSAVYSAICCQKGAVADDADRDAKVAVKRFKAAASRSTRSALLHYEVSTLLRARRHPNIVQVHGIFYGHLETEASASAVYSKWSMVMQYCSGGDLHHAVSARPLSETRSRQVVAGLLSAIDHLHARDIVHRNVTARTILFDHDGSPKLSNFGSACHLSEIKLAKRRIPGATPHEEEFRFQLGAQVDSFCAGMVLYFALCGQAPFHPNEFPSTEQREVDVDSSFYFAKVSAECKRFLVWILATNPEDCPTAFQARSHSWPTNLHAIRLDAAIQVPVPPPEDPTHELYRGDGHKKVSRPNFRKLRSSKGSASTRVEQNEAGTPSGTILEISTIRSPRTSGSSSPCRLTSQCSSVATDPLEVDFTS